MKIKKCKSILYLLLIILVFFISDTSYAKLEFSDVKVNAWYYKDLEMLTSRNVINGYTDGTFKPNNTLTREEFIKMVVTTIAPIKYEKDSSRWSMPYLKAAKDYGFLMYDINDKEIFKKQIPREEVAFIISCVLGEGYEDYEKYQNTIKDYNLITPAFAEGVLKIYSKGIIGGYPDGTFGPKKSLTRAEATAIISRMLNKSMRLIDFDKSLVYTLTTEDINRLKSYSKNQELKGYKTEITSQDIKELEKEFGIDFETFAKEYVENFMFGYDYRFISSNRVLASNIVSNVIYQSNFARYDHLGGTGSTNRKRYIERVFDKIEEDKLIADAVFCPLEGGTYISENNTIRVRGMVVQRYLSTQNPNYNTNYNYKYDIEVEIILDYDIRPGVSTYYELVSENNKYYTLEDIKNLYNKDLLKIAKEYIENLEFNANYEMSLDELIDKYSKHFDNYSGLKIEKNGDIIFNDEKVNLYFYILGKHNQIVQKEIKQTCSVTGNGEIRTDDNTTLYLPLTLNQVYTSYNDKNIKLNQSYVENIEVIFKYDLVHENYYIAGFNVVD